MNLEISGDMTATVDESLTLGGFTPGMGGLGATLTMIFGSIDTFLVSIAATEQAGRTQGSFGMTTSQGGFADQGGEGCELTYSGPDDGTFRGTVECTDLESDDGSMTVDVSGTFEGSS